MDDTISRQAAFESVHSLFKPLPQYLADKMNVGYNHALADTLATLKALPSAERRGRWETEITTNRDGTKSARYACSVCGVMALDEWHYCPNCGARMEGEQNG